ncbi:MAG: site-specific integrase [Boseongicola sp.]|nr:site-specific integrase [Boseongicola sp.]
MALTEKKIRDAKPGEKTRIEWDTTVKGLGLRITPAGAKAFILNYRIDGRERRATIGRPGELALADARELAGRELAAIRQGEADPLARREAVKAMPTVADGMAAFFDSYVPGRMADGRMSDRTAQEYTWQWKRIAKAAPWFAALRIEAVTRGDVERVLSGRKPVDRNRNLAFLSRVFRYFELREYRPQNANPCRLIEKAKEVPRDRVLTPAELQALAASLTALESAKGADPFPIAAIRFLTLTGWRAGEAVSLLWEHVSFDTGEIVLPDTKTGRQVRKVGVDALDLMKALPRLNSNPHVFAGHYGGGIGYKRLRQVFRKACDAAGIADARLHDLRRSVATYAAASGLSVTLLRDLLGHKTLNMAARYARRADSALHQAQDESAARMAAMMAGE